MCALLSNSLLISWCKRFIILATWQRILLKYQIVLHIISWTLLILLIKSPSIAAYLNLLPQLLQKVGNRNLWAGTFLDWNWPDDRNGSFWLVIIFMETWKWDQSYRQDSFKSFGIDRLADSVVTLVVSQFTGLSIASLFDVFSVFMG